MNVVHVTNPNTVPFGGMSANTVYVFPSGTYYLPDNVPMRRCTAFISSGNTTITTDNTYNIFVDGESHVIFDKININANHHGDAGLEIINEARDVTLHNMDIYNAVSYGVHTFAANTLFFDAVNIFNNPYGAYFAKTDAVAINNSKIYNNGNNGITIEGGNQHSINNSLIFNSEEI